MNIENMSDKIDNQIKTMLSLFHTRDIIYMGGESAEILFPNAEDTPRPMVFIDFLSDPWGDKQQQGIDTGIAEDEEHKRALWDIDGLLGTYDSSQYRIVLYAKSISRVVNEFPRDSRGWEVPDFNQLANIVLLHELGHWASHQVKDKDGKEWENFSDVSEKHKEEWAQVLAYWTLKEMNDEDKKLCDIFGNMQRKQRSVYKPMRTRAIVDSMWEEEDADYTANFLLSELFYARRKSRS